MSQTFPIVYLARHGETAWTITGQHTGRTDLPLTERGEEMARRLGERLNGNTFAKVFTSPCLRAVQTCNLAGFGAVAEIERDLVEWDYGEYEGRLSADILAERPGWQLFRDGCPGGESPNEVAARADRMVDLVRSRRRRVAVLQWPLSANAGRALDWGGANCRPVVDAEHGEPEQPEP